ncbi:RING finger protein 224 [Clarias gariepinus]|uniref:RING finger protein 224 n=1 Tax=Clarias gariepinus TaxID=13013 RepID=UPI00234CCB49|nr:RING finger protein 224 [Clarias gariepinus]
MVLTEDHECGVCYERYSRSKHVPRVLFCNHTFCCPCLETLATQQGGMLSIRCPLCRQVSCVRQGLTLEEALWVNNQLWEHIGEVDELKVKWDLKEEEEHEEQGKRSAVAKAASPEQPQWPRPSCHHIPSLRLRLPGFLRRMIDPRQERIIPGSNVQIKSWRRLSGEELP